MIASAALSGTSCQASARAMRVMPSALSPRPRVRSASRRLVASLGESFEGWIAPSSAAARMLTAPSACSWVATMMASGPISRRIWAMASPIDAAVKVRRRIRSSPYTAPTVFSRALGWISFWLITTVEGRKRSVSERT